MDQGEAKSNENHSSSSSSSSGDSNPCPICLGPFLQESYLDSCFHKFCYNCILQWTKVVAGKHSRSPSSLKCPLCKTENFSIIFGYDGSSFQRQYVNVNVNFEHSSFFSKAHKYRLKCYYTEPGILSNIVNVSRYWKSHKYLQPNRWLLSWLRREIQALLQEEDVEIIVHHILGVVDSFLKRGDQFHQMKTPEAKQGEFKTLVSNAARPFLAARTERFVNELEMFLASSFNIQAYDEVYMQQLGWNIPRVIGEAADAERGEHEPVIPYLYIFYDDSDEAD
ncbi:uncharacterized protein LOC110622256 [Manihot esculenta]|uniref:RING-type domain-containing protein n=1 Tax=Manihot esculenta TaxID=3983 RepID=A0A2C9VBD9_MANES|nr:uncharacterized protein LOC110622256 [Manihot esculenta]OAY42258.1 hypothetical protein MANES_09G165400v8 [Manihot esculenta]